MSEIIDKIDEAIEHIADTHEDLVACMLLEKAKEKVRVTVEELEKKIAEFEEYDKKLAFVMGKISEELGFPNIGVTRVALLYDYLTKIQELKNE
jgi:hypothetical protein